MWDANSTVSNKDIIQLLNSTDMIDLMPTTHEKFSTYLRGSTVIDQIWGTYKISQNLKRHGYTAFHQNAWYTDHRALFIDLDSNIFDIGIMDDPQPPTRTIRSSNAQHVLQFLTALEKTNITESLLLLSNNLLTSTVEWNTESSKIFEQLDTDFTNLLLDAEKTLPLSRNQPWSPELHEAFQIYTYIGENSTQLVLIR